MIQIIKIEGFKSILSMTLELARVNCFIGANGVGKSNILEAIGVLSAARGSVIVVSAIAGPRPPAGTADERANTGVGPYDGLRPRTG